MRKQLHNGGVTSQTYDCAGRLLVVENYGAGGAAVNIFTYAYDCSGHKITALELDGAAFTWSYDKSRQLTHQQRSGTNAFDVAYTYDDAGNRTTQSESGAVTTYTCDADNRLLSLEDSSGVTTFSYDDCGNRTQKETPSETTYYFGT